MTKKQFRGHNKLITQSKAPSSRKGKRITISFKRLRDIAYNRIKKNTGRSMKSTKQVYKIKNRVATTLKINSLVCEENFNCPICLDLLIKPIITQCGHYYCERCADQAMPNQGICCVCRQTVDDSLFKVQKSMQAMLKNYISSKLTLEQQLNYFERQKQCEDFQKKRKIPSDISLGDCVDFRIKNIWKEGIILEVTDTTVVVGCKNHEEKKITFQRSSKNIAKFRTFTKQKIQKITEIIPVVQNVVTHSNVYNEVFWEFTPVINNSSMDRWILEQPDYFPQDNNNSVWGAIY